MSVQSDVLKAMKDEDYLDEILIGLNSEVPEKTLFDKVYDKINEI